MKAIKYLMMGALLIGFNASAMSQEDHKAVIEQAAKIIQAKGSNTENQIKNIAKANKKNADVLVGIGRAYLSVKDTASAMRYAQLAMQRNKNFGDAYVLAGDVETIMDNGGAASSWFEQAIYFDPKNPEGYRRYAQINSKTNPSASVAKLEELRIVRPDYPVDLVAAEIYDKAGNINKALEYYNKTDKANMADNQLANFALLYFLKGEFQKSLDVSSYGNQKFPRDPALNRITFYNNTNIKKYAEALTYADKLFNQSDSTKITESDYLYYGYAYLGNKDYDKAIEMFNKSLAENTDNEADKNDALKNIASAYQLKGDFTNAVATYEKYISSLATATAVDYDALAKMYLVHADDLTGAAKKAMTMKADSVYADMVAKFESNADYATLQRAHIAFSLDPETKTGIAKPLYEKLIEIINAKAEKNERDNERLIESYRYLGYYYLLKKNKNASNAYWNKILELDPTNETAKQALGK